jgi:Xaa-Pro aminopeptidase
MNAKDELRSRTQKLQKMMQQHECDGFIIMQNVDLYYFSGTMQNAWFYIPAAGDPVLFCRKSFERAKAESPWDVVNTANFKAVPEQITLRGMPLPKRIAIEYDVTPVSSYMSFKKIFPQSELIDGSQWVRNIRAVKSSSEILELKTAGSRIADAFSRISGVIKPGMTEIQCAMEIQRLMHESSCDGIIRFRGYNQELYFGHFLSGPSGAMASFNDGATAGQGIGAFFPQGPGNKTVLRNEPLHLDYMGICNGYMVDQTRVFVIGALPEKLYRAFNVAMEIQQSVIENTKPGVIPDELWKLALAIVNKAGLQDHFMGHGANQAKFVGHGTGLEVDELPVLAGGFKTPLEENMVFALEPKFVFPGEGIVGIENTWKVTSTGTEKLTPYQDEVTVIKG